MALREHELKEFCRYNDARFDADAAASNSPPKTRLTRKIA